MREPLISNLFRIQQRFLRSAHLERDFADPAALKGYVLTPHARAALDRLLDGIRQGSAQRAWRITGDYGSGKSSFGLLLAHLMAGKYAELPVELKRSIQPRKLGIDGNRFVPMLVTGTREPLGLAIVRALQRGLEALPKNRALRQLREKAKGLAELSEISPLSDTTVIDILTDTAAAVKAQGLGTGLLIIVDELGKFLEFSALHPDRQDVFLLQRLAETAARSGENPIFIVGLLHQGFSAYADLLSLSAQKEWEKVAGRYEEILFAQPIEQTTGLITSALNIRSDRLADAIAREAVKSMSGAIELGWFGVTASRNELAEIAKSLYPLHPTVVPVLVNLFKRFGQNERSLFSFLISNEPFGLQEFAATKGNYGRFFRLHDLYDYTRATFGHRLSVQSYRSHWNQIDSIVSSFPAEDAVEVQILKTVGMLNLLDSPNLLASDEAIAGAVGVSKSNKAFSGKLQFLHKTKRILYYRGAAGGYCLWPYTSINLERAYEEATQALGPAMRISAVIKNYLDTRPLVARRHYIETGNLRHFAVRYLPVNELTAAADFDLGAADGVILVPFCETEDEHQDAVRFTKSSVFTKRPEILLAIPKPLGSLAGLVQELQRWQWIAENTPELNHDEYAAEEVARQIEASRDMLQRRVNAFIGLRQTHGQTELEWYQQNNRLSISSGRDLLSFLSSTCDRVYSRAPRVKNELVNRRAISSAAAAARMRLIERVFKHPREPFMGMDPDKKPPEMSIYLSLFKNGGLHRESDGEFKVTTPVAGADICNLHPAFDRIRQFLEGRPDKRVSVSRLYAELRKPPFGVRGGIIPILLAVFGVVNEQDIAFYENGVFLRHVTGFDFMRLIKDPDTFEIQYCKIAGIRTELFDLLVQALQLPASKQRRFDLLDIVRPLCVFAAQLPAYTHKTQSLSPVASEVRSVLVAAEEPATLLFRQLPAACGLDEFKADEEAETERVREFVEVLKATLDELRGAFPQLQEQMKSILAREFGVPGPLEGLRSTLAERAEAILLHIKDQRLRALVLRLADANLPDSDWLESLGSVVCSMPPSKWTDDHFEVFRQEIEMFAGRFARVESMAFRTGRKRPGQSALRVAITSLDGGELDRVIYFGTDDEAKVQEIEKQIDWFLKHNKQLGLVAVARAFWRALEKANDVEQ
ncbi:MAG: hypothetical protein UZ17_ACD001002847 [Acidobacteria bacterium OLB17]|nr:MAG: hypothetical protein UZ17_ACD001002847 [Acidobacteria bacterium OLB17]